MRSEPGGGERLTELIWGDHVHLTGSEVVGEHVEIEARGHSRPGWVPTNYISEQGLLEFYVIDVGQGDGVLLRTPDGDWHLVDAGVSNGAQMTKKGAVNFIRWKFRKDLKQRCALKTVVLSHPDFDHYGGLINLLSGDLEDSEAPFEVDVDRFFHCGLGRFDTRHPLGKTVRGELDGGPRDDGLSTSDKFIVEMLDDARSFAEPSSPFDGSFKELAALVANKVAVAARLGADPEEETWLPGYSPDDGVTGPEGIPLTVRVLGPILEKFRDVEGSERVGLRELSSKSVTRNGHSITLRFDYGDARILLTGDLNAKSQRLLLSYIDASEYAVDVAKGCHHGSEDVDMRFLAAMKARTTVLSSGDNEDYSHPRPVIMGASAFHGREILNSQR